MLPSAHRMRRSADFSTAVRSGHRVRRGGVVVHHLAASPGDGKARVAAQRPALVGFIVGRAIGGSVVRHRTTRRLRAILAGHVRDLPAGSATVVRALPDAATSTWARLAQDVDGALARLVPERTR